MSTKPGQLHVVDRTYGGGSDAFVAAFDLNGVHQATTYLGGREEDNGEGIDVAPNGNVVITGATRPPSFSTTTTTWEGSDDEDGFLVVLSSNLKTLEFSARIGGSAEDRLRATAVSAAGRVGVVGMTWADDYPIDLNSAAWSNNRTGSYWDRADAVFGVYDLPQTLPVSAPVCGGDRRRRTTPSWTSRRKPGECISVILPPSGPRSSSAQRRLPP